jgi:cell division protein FtsN
MPPIAYKTKHHSAYFKYIAIAVAAVIIILLLLLYRKTMRESGIETMSNQQSQKELTKEEVMQSISAPPDANPQPVPKETLNTITAPQKKEKTTKTATASNESNVDPETLKSLTAPSK